MEEAETEAGPKCPLCGGVTFIEGIASPAVSFTPQTTGLVNLLLVQSEWLAAKKCRACGHVLFFGVPE
jgi:predicted nucleic-acid-binding Zn-ribbon protein